MSFAPPTRLTLLLALLLAVSQPGCSREAGKGADAKAAEAKPGDFKPEPASAADEKTIRAALGEKLKDLPAIDEVRKTAIVGLFEVRFGGSNILYTDAQGRYVVEGALIDTRTMSNLTEARLEALTAVAFDKLPLKDALVFKQGDGSRRLAVFGDPNCGYCKRFERELMALPNVTLYTFVMPILGADSTVKARNIWCAAEPAKAWRAWMLDGVAAPGASADCDAAALVRNAEFGRKHRINATPGVVFADGSKRSGAMSVQQMEALIAVAAAKKS